MIDDKVSKPTATNVSSTIRVRVITRAKPLGCRRLLGLGKSCDFMAGVCWAVKWSRRSVSGRTGTFFSEVGLYRQYHVEVTFQGLRRSVVTVGKENSFCSPIVNTRSCRPEDKTNETRHFEMLTDIFKF